MLPTGPSCAVKLHPHGLSAVFHRIKRAVPCPACSKAALARDIRVESVKQDDEKPDEEAMSSEEEKPYGWEPNTLRCLNWLQQITEAGAPGTGEGEKEDLAWTPSVYEDGEVKDDEDDDDYETPFYRRIYPRVVNLDG